MTNKHLFWLIVFVVEFSINTANYAGGQSENCQNFDNSNRPYGVCPSINIKSIQHFKQLENCTVVEGYVQIAIFNIPPNVFEHLSFPDLREITDFLLIYRVTGLVTLHKLFPNLSVIRGRQLFNFYSMVIYENRDLQELGLVNLRVISRGGIKFSRNFKLCYIQTVNWSQIGVPQLSMEMQKNNQQCPKTCRSDCEPKYCWSYYDCQKGFACHCKENQSCMENGTCCHEYCLGGCKGTTAEDCYSCKDVIFNNTCRPQCPPGTYTHLNRRCLTDRECLSLKNDSEGRSPMLLHGEKGEPNYCVYNCPQNYTFSESKGKNYTECVKCTEFCHKECNGLELTGIQDAQKLQGCSKIVGSLTIQIMKGTAAVEEELEKSLGSIREITQVLTIKKSLALYSLYFLKSLEIIRGISNGTSSGAAFTLIDNQNLQELFPTEQMKKLKILNGRLLFYDNRQLCLHKIDEFVKYLNVTNVEGINRFSNGDQRPCLQDLLNLTVNVYSHTSVVLKWDKYQAEHRQLLTYILNYKEVSDLNEIPIIQYGRDSCSNDVWMTREYPPVDGPDTFQLGLLRELKPFTAYAVYVQAYTVTTATHSAMTDVITFKTLPFYPSEPRDLIAISENPCELRVKWKPPKAPNGIVKYYKIIYQKLELSEKPYEQRDYCKESFSAPKEKEIIRLDEEEKKFNYSKDCCKCPKSKEEQDDENKKRQVEVFFEDYLHKNIYCKRYDKLPDEVDNTLATISIEYIMEHSVGEELWRSIEERSNETNLNETLLAETLSIGGGGGLVDEGGGSIQEANNVSFTNVMEVEVYNSTEAVLPNLEHFSEYSIEVMACHETNTNLSNGLKYCSIRAITLERTKPAWHLDLINESSIVVEVEKNFTKGVFIKWDAPSKPNGLILNYHIKYKIANQDNVVANSLCVNRTEYLKNHGHRFNVNVAGNYTFKISAFSLAGNMTFTQEKYFIVPKSPELESSSTVVIVVVVIIALVVCIFSISTCIYCRKKMLPTGPTVISRNMNYVTSDYVYRLDEWEVSRDKIKLIKELGKGSFGMVYEGIAKGLSGDDPEEETRVAVKTVNELSSYSNKHEFLKEATIMKAFDCHHVVKLLGVVSKGQPNLVIMELMLLGDLKKYLRQLRPDEEHPDVIPPTLVDILQMAGEIADGMAYLADKKFVHRDLAARNCMVAEDRTVKIGDFGMTRDIYETDYYRKGGKGMLPVRWMAPESIKDGVFTSMSDVWSFGVVLWEMVTLAAQPYQGLSNDEVLKFVTDGCIMEMPENCPEDMAYLMRCCWEKKPNRRPTFKTVIRFLLPKLKPSFEKVSYYYSSGNTHDGSGDGIIELPEGSDDAISINSLNCEGAAAPRQSSLTRSSTGGNSHYKGSDVVFQYNDDIVPQNYIHDDEEDSFNSEYGDDIDDSSQPFMPDSYVSTVVTRQPLQLSHQSIENDTSLHNSGLIELKPLINKDKSLGISLPRLATVQQPTSPRLVTVQQSSDYLGHQPPTLKTDMEPLHGNHSLPQNNPPYLSTADSLRSAAPSTGASSQQSTRHHTPGALVPRPNLRLPTLNQTAVAALYNVSLLNSGDNDKNSDTNRNSQFCSSDQPFSQPPAPLSTVNLVHIENGLGASTVTSSSLPNQHYSSSTPGAIANNSSDGSKESTKSSESYSLRNGLTNGHIYLPSDKHRTAHC